MDRFKSDIEKEIDLAQARLEKLIAERENAQDFPKEPDVGKAVKFQVQFDAYGPSYTYVAYRFSHSAHGWTLTGKHTGVFTWRRVVKLAMEDVAVSKGHRPLYFQVGF